MQRMLCALIHELSADLRSIVWCICHVANAISSFTFAAMGSETM